MILDSHVHLSKSQLGPYAKSSFEQITNALLKEMAANHIDHALLLPMVQEHEIAGMQTCIKAAQQNKNLHALGTINGEKFSKPDLAALESALNKGQIKGLKLYPGYWSFYPQDIKLKPVYQLCLKYDVPVIFHAGGTFGDNTARLKYSHPLNIDELAAENPDLKIIIAHLGMPWFIDTAEVIYKNPNVFADLSGFFYSDRLPGSKYGELIKRQVQEVIKYASPRQLLFGTDWPLHPIKSYIKFVQSLGIGPKDLEQVMGKTAGRLFKI